MKKSIAYLPKNKQEDLYYLVSMIRKKLPEAVMIILYGSYARNEYVDYNERIEFGIPVAFMSDYDILVVTHGISDKKAGSILHSIKDIYFKYPDTQTPVQFINESIYSLNQNLSERRYFYTKIKMEGIILYDSGQFKLARRRKLRYDEIKQQAEEYFEEKFDRANSFLRSANHDYNDVDYRMGSFHLHQACENYYHTIRLVFTLDGNKLHNLDELFTSVKSYSDDLKNVFPQNTTEENRLFELLKAAYVEARYNMKFIVTKEDIDALTPKVELLRDITARICLQQIKEYEQLC